jgi:hypothetical protein
MRKLERQHTALVQIELIFVGLAVMQNLHVTTLHAHSQPIPTRTITKREYLRRKVMLTELASFAHVPSADSVVQATSKDAATLKINHRQKRITITNIKVVINFK